MKRTLIAAAAVLAAGTAFAQSSVTIYGRVNTSVEYQKDGDVKTTVLQNNASRWGLRGSEDLGGGMKGLFVLESGFASDTGAGTQGGTTAGTSRLFGRESWVGVQGNFGRVRLGNMGPSAAYYATADYVSMHNHDTGTSSDAFYLYPGVMQNAVAYNTPSFGGVVVEVQYALKQIVNTANGASAEDRTGKHTGVVAINYDKGPLHLGASYLDSANTNGGIVGDKGKEFGLRGLYELGPVTVGAYWVRNEITDFAGLKDKRDAYRLSAMYTFGGSELHANVGFASKIKSAGVTQADTSALQYTVAYNYNLSKRTKVYAFYTKVDNKDNIGYSVTTPGTDFSSVALGVRHNF